VKSSSGIRLLPWMLLLVAAAEPAAQPIVKDASERAKIEAALPSKALAEPRKGRKLLIFNLNVNYGGHPSAAHASYAFSLMGQKTGAFATVISREASVFKPESLRQFDAVFLNNTVGNLFEDPQLRQSLMEFVCAGGGLLGVHGTSVAFTQWPGAKEDWPEFGVMIGARGANHRNSDEHVFIKLDDPEHPLNQAFGGKGFDYRDEFFRVHEPYSRDRVRVLFSIDMGKTDASEGGAARGNAFRADNDYALAWVRNYGGGRVFYCTIAHNPSVFWDPQMLRFYLGAIQFALGDLPAPTTPSSRLTRAIRAQEKLGWRLGIEAGVFQKSTLFEAIDSTAKLGLLYIGGLSSQKVSREITSDFGPELSDDVLRQVRMKLDAAGVRLLTYHVRQMPGDEAGCRRVFEFARKMGIETLISEPTPESLGTIERFCDEYDVKLAIYGRDGNAWPDSWDPEAVLRVCQGRSKRIGVCGDLGQWMQNGVDPIKAIRLLKDRLITVRMHDRNQLGKEGQDVLWGTGVGQTEQFVREMRALGIAPTMFAVEYSREAAEAMPEIGRCVEFFNKLGMQMAE